ncbi:glycosyltransferase family 2 protein [Parvularcula lutaonensis]|uniref:Glycosyltransferase family 2 protein n=1 Tax=Parvularcula lutaonensis TaxID=491923 RepID=A0ABV7MC75_9PROT|nr:glycosyltransferase family 2 protein [Parvularcula lutaonensis]GGY49433.1 polyprenol phosphate mannosyl transferase 1 (Ppm1) [Parvularcula lutaonensis]
MAEPATPDGGLFFSVVMPAYNEEAVIEKTLLDLTDYLDKEGFHYEVIVVDDGSADRTGAIVASVSEQRPQVRCVRNEGPGGFGFAIRKGLESYQGEAVVIVTADGADAPKDVAAYFRKIEEGFDACFGSRFSGGAVVKDYPKLKLLMNRASNMFLSLVLRRRYDDFTNGFKCYRREVIDAISPIVSGQFNITIELSVKTILGGWKYAVVPNDWSEREGGASSFNVVKLIRPYFVTLIYCMSESYIKRVRR